MRPLNLEIEGFRSHQSTTVISFEDRSLLAIVGPTGAGKSSILDAISYALYAKTPREERDTKDLICSRAELARVELRFAADGREYEITRAMRRKGGPAPHVLRDLSSGEAITGRSAVTDKVIELLGLDFAGFGSAVLLAQGEFAQFLQATPKKRSQILKGVFRLEQVDALREAARFRVDELDRDLRDIEVERRGIPENVEELLEETANRRDAASKRAAVLLEAIPKEQELEARLQSRSGDAELAREELVKLELTAKKVPTEEELADLDAQGSSIAELLADADSAASAASEERSAALRARSELVEELGSEGMLVELRAKALALEDLKQESAEREEAVRAHKVALKELRRQVTQTEARHGEAVQAAEAATKRRREVEQAHAAHALRADLQVGDPCPVCEVVVEAVPAIERPTAMAEVDEAERFARAAERKAAERSSAAARSLAVAESDKDHLEGELARNRARKGQLEAELQQSLGPAASFEAEVEARLARFREVDARVQAAEQALESARLTLEERRLLQADFSRLCRAAAAALIEVAAYSGIDPVGVDDPMPRLIEGAEATRRALASTMRSVEDRLEGALRAQQETGEALAALRASLELPQGRTIAAAFGDARSEADVADALCADLEKKKVRSGELDEQQAAVTARQRTFKQLASDLSDSKFTSFLLEEKTQLLLELASARLHAMTARYRLELLNDKLNVIDELDGDKRRAVDTLSGGETFLASLALALALAELVTRAGGRLQCFFLDEGFGSLDPESFENALRGIERIVSPDRLIGLVSHVPALADWVDDRIELDKGDDGMTVVKSGAALR